MEELKQHARLSPSASERWMKCTASVALVDKLPPQPSSVFAEEGTRAHALLEHMCTHKGQVSPNVEYDAEMLGHVIEAYRYFESRRRLAIGSYVEQRLHLGKLTEGECWGTGDMVFVYEDEVEIADFKYGKGIPVSPERNSQLALYAIGACATFNLTPSKITLTIIQPRCGDEAVRSWSCTLPELVAFGRKVNDAYQAIKSGDTVFHASEETCRWCPAIRTCPEVQKHALAMAKTEFAPMPTIEVEQLAEILRVAPAVESFISDAREAALKVLLAGGEVPGYKVVEGRSNRKWKDPERAATVLAKLLKLRTKAQKATLFTQPELISVAQAEKLFKASTNGAWPMLDEFIDKPVGKPTLATSTDKRPALTADFTVITEE